MAAARPTKRGKRRPHAARRSNRGAEFLAPTRGLRRLQGSISGCREKLAATAPRRPSGRGHTAPSPAGLTSAGGAFHCLARMAQDSAALSLRGRFLRISFDSPRRFPAGFFLSASKPRWPLPRSSDLHVQSLPRRETGGVFLSVWKTRACI